MNKTESCFGRLEVVLVFPHKPMAKNRSKVVGVGSKLTVKPWGAANYTG